MVPERRSMLLSFALFKGTFSHENSELDTWQYPQGGLPEPTGPLSLYEDTQFLTGGISTGAAAPPAAGGLGDDPSSFVVGPTLSS